MRKNIEVSLTVTSTDSEKIKEMRKDYDINISEFFRESIRKEHKKLKRKVNDCK